MTRIDVENIILTCLIPYKPERIGIFGSFARNEDNSQSDIDLLVSFYKTPSLLQLIRMETELSNKLGQKVDLITEGAIKNSRIKESIYRDLNIIYNA